MASKRRITAARTADRPLSVIGEEYVIFSRCNSYPVLYTNSTISPGEPDQWYALHNPERATTPMTVNFSLSSRDFRNEEIDDLLLVLTYEGRTPAWAEY